MFKKAIALATAAALAVFSLMGCAGNAATSDKTSDSQEKTEQAAETQEPAKAAPVTADKIKDGTYSITVDSRYGKLFMGTGDEAAAASEADCIPFVANAEGRYTYDVPVTALDEDVPCAAWSIKKEQWYDRTLVFESAGVELK